MLAIAGGAGAALVFATVTLCNSRSSRMIGPTQLLAWVMLIGLIVIAPLVAMRGVPAGLDVRSGTWLAIAGVGNVLGLLLAYAALRAGKVGVVAPLVSTQGAIAALIAVLAGETIAAAAGFLLVVIALGVALASIAPEERRASGVRHEPRATLYGLGAAFAIAWSLYATARASIDLPVVWALLPSRAIGVAAVTVPVALRSGLRMTRRALPLVAVSGVCEVAGFALFAFGARHGIAVAAVLSSQFAAIAAVGAYLLFRERLTRLQLAGVALVAAGVGALSGVQA
jgi:drug/metabolite transporter (DMT)-like permease